MSEYFENKKRQGLIFTLHNIDTQKPYICMKNDPKSISCKPVPVPMPVGPSFWSRLSGRYRTAEEQREYLASGCVDRALPVLTGDDEPAAAKICTPVGPFVEDDRLSA